MGVKRISVLFAFIFLLLISGCAATFPTQPVNPEAQLQMQRFEAAKSLTASEIPDIYNASRLRPGSSVKIKYTGTNSEKPYFSSKVLRDIKSNGANKVYIIDSASNDAAFTFEENPSSLAKIISPQEDLTPMKDYKMPEGDNLPTKFIQSAPFVSLAGAPFLIMDYYRMKGINEDVSKHIKGMRVETKVIDFKFISSEIVRVTGKDIPCKIYQVHSLTRQTSPPTKRIPSPAFIMEEVKKIWISDDIPFGIVKSSSIMQAYICPDSSSHFQPQMLNSDSQEHFRSS